MTKVSREQFYKRIFADNLDVHPSVVEISRDRCVSEWTFHRRTGRPVYGRTVHNFRPEISSQTEYYLA